MCCYSFCGTDRTREQPLIKRITDLFVTGWHHFVTAITFEWILRTRARRSNGGDVILARSFLTALAVFLFILVIENLLDPDRTWQFSMDVLRRQMISKLPWFGGIFAAVYVGLYTRFSSQWSYLANVYNQIKSAEVKAAAASSKKTSAAETALAEWKAGFIEYAEYLHLATKESVAPVIYHWGRQPLVMAEYLRGVPAGEERYRLLMDAVARVVNNMTERTIGIPATLSTPLTPHTKDFRFHRQNGSM